MLSAFYPFGWVSSSVKNEIMALGFDFGLSNCKYAQNYATI
jgi:hypothetical protein